MGANDSFGEDQTGRQNHSVTVSRDSAGKITQVVRTDPTQTPNALKESYTYTYLVMPDPNAGQLSKVVQRRGTDPNTAPIVRVATYTYYPGGSLGGNAGDLESASVWDNDPPTANLLDRTYYRYFLAGDMTGYVHGLKMVVGPQAYARLKTALQNDPMNPMPDALYPNNPTDAQVTQFIDYQYLYYPDADANAHRVKQVTVQGAGCSSCSGGQGTFKYSYTTSNNGIDANKWLLKTVETLPDNNTITVYSNGGGEPMLRLFELGAPGTTHQRWGRFYQYDPDGRIIMKAYPSAVITETGNPAMDVNFDQYADLLNKVGSNYTYLQNSMGRIELTDYNLTMATVAPGYYLDSKVQQGQNGIPIWLRSVTYTSKQASTGSMGNGGQIIYPIATSTVYRNPNTVVVTDPTTMCYPAVTDKTNCETTTYTYNQWWTNASGDTVQPQQITVTKPVILSGDANNPDQHGPGGTASDTEVTNFDKFGRVSQRQDGDGFVTSYQYDPGTGAMTQMISDPGTSPHLNLTTTMVVDKLGRTTILTDPNQNITYAIYNDSNYETRVYPGWNTATNMPTGPTRSFREDRAHSNSDTTYNPTYTDVLTMSAPPHLTGNLPDGSESPTAIQSLTRSYTSKGGQVYRSDAYFDLPNMTPANFTLLYAGTPGVVNSDGTVSGNYWSSFYGYDARGRQNRVQTPTGTIYRTVYDGLSRVVSTLVGTDDTNWPTTCTSPCNMIQVSASTYDGGGLGDSNLTSRIDYPSGAGSTADQRETDMLYDWRDRRVLTKQGVQATEDTNTHRPIFYSAYDNLNEITGSSRYDGDQQYLTNWPYTNGVPNRPSFTLLRAQTQALYDNQQRVFEAILYSVNQINGLLSVNTLKTDYWYDHRGNLIRQSVPGGIVTKSAYDGVSRPITVYTSDGLESGQTGTSWQKAFTIAGDTVVTQTENLYDSNSNVILVRRRDRFHDATALGALQNVLTDPKARVSFVGSYFDKADRLTDRVDVGTNQGNNWDRLAPPNLTPPPRSDSVLVTSYGYKADAVVRVAISGSPSGGNFTLSYNGTPTGMIVYNAAASDVQLALQPVVGNGNALVSGPAGGPWLVRFSGTLGEQAVSDLTGTGSITGGTLSVVPQSQGGDSGRVQKMTDPRALISKTDYDAMGRTLRTTENFVAFAPSDGSDRQTEFTYDGSSHVLTRVAKLSNTVSEKTQYVYGVTNSNCSTTGSCLNSNDLLYSVTYPGQATVSITGATNASPIAVTTSTAHKLVTGSVITISGVGGNTAANGTWVVTVTGTNTFTLNNSSGNGTYTSGGSSYAVEANAYNALAQKKNMTDRNGNQHQYSFDVLGRQTSDAVTQLGAGVDNRVLRLDTAYNALGLAATFTSYNSANGTDPVNNQVSQVQRTFSGLRQLITEAQIHGNSQAPVLNVQYTYSFSGVLGGPNHSRLKNIIYPNARIVRYEYNAGLDDSISRVSFLADDNAGAVGTHLEEFSYLGLNTVVKRAHPEPSVDLSYINAPGGSSDGGDQYTGLDRFGRVLDQYWAQAGAGTDSFQYTYDRDSNRLARNNLLRTQYHDFDEAYTSYDGFNQLQTFVRNSAHVVGNTHNEGWTLDNLGNWKNFTNDQTGPPTENRTHNVQNQIASIDAGLVTPTYDANGNTTKDERGNLYTYDAWNRLAAAAGVVFGYDALNRRIIENPGTATDLYYSKNWQVLEERQGVTVTAQNVWSPVYVDAMVLRDGSQRLYVQQDANWNVTGIVGNSGGWGVQERYVYDPYGKATVLDPVAWTVRGAGTYGTSSFGWVYLHQGGRYTSFGDLSGLYYFRNRDLSPTLGRWMEEDPIGYGAGDNNLYRYEGDSASNKVDPSGMVERLGPPSEWGRPDPPKPPRGPQDQRGGPEWLFYGKYCGPGQAVPLDQGDQSIDKLDSCCFGHDKCLKDGGRWGPYRFFCPDNYSNACDKDFCDCLATVDCAEKYPPGPEQTRCAKYWAEAFVAFCVKSVPIPIRNWTWPWKQAE